MAATANEPPLIAVVGETASGKSSFALATAKRIGGEIIAADSRTIYKGMDIGTAKPTAEDQRAIPHHLLDVVEPSESFTAAEFQRLALRAIDDIAARGHFPIVVGGSGLYLDALLFEYKFTSRASSAQRELFTHLSTEDLLEQVAAAGYAPADSNRRHLIRLLERGPTETSDRTQLRHHTLVIGFSPSRAQLRKRIETRVEVMFRQGLRREVEELRKEYGWDSEALTGIGYREFRAFYDQGESMGSVKRQIVQDTLHLAKRQRTWFKRNSHIHWVESEEQAAELVDTFISEYKL